MATATLSLNLYEVLQIGDINSQFTCFGYAPSKGRRCHNPIAIANRQNAIALLYQMSRDGTSSANMQYMEYMLQSLASRILCKRNHQNQAPYLVDRWLHEIERYRISEMSRVMGDMLATLGALSIARPARSQAVVWSPMVDTRASPQETIRNTPVRTPTRLASNPNRALPNDRPDGQIERDGNDSNQRRNTSSQSENNPSISASSGHRPLPRPEPREVQEHQHESGRRLLHGECSICLDEFTDGSSVTWCRAQCGQNFHQDCIGIWLRTTGSHRRCPNW